ncbi:MAG: VCBS repeat-containing protein [Phycisphaeraceae bacterium]|nr:VCBS repeat-containing protein [Phycisphaeraceae bacterium]
MRWSSVNILPWTNAEQPQIIIMETWLWLAQQRTIHTVVDKESLRDKIRPYNQRLPLYDAGQSFTGLPHGQYQPLFHDDGGYDLLNLSNLTYHTFRGRDASGPQFDQPYKVESQGNLYGNKFAADIDGDGIPDLLISRVIDGHVWWEVYPFKENPWQAKRMDHMGPHRDLEVTEGFRGYDIDGDWLGSQVNHVLYWAKGERVNGQLRFGPVEYVYYGRDDFPVQWRSYNKLHSPAVIERDGQTWIVLFGELDRALAMPLLGLVDGRMTCGKAQPLMHDNQPIPLVNMPNVLGVIDMTGDSRDEIVLGSGSSGRIVVIGGESVGQFESLGTPWMIGGYVCVDTLAVPARGDWDRDGWLDLVIGDGSGLFSLWRGTEDPLVYAGCEYLTQPDGVMIQHSGKRNLQGAQEHNWSYTQAELFDWDGDGRLDLIANDNTATFRLYRRVDPDDPLKVAGEIFTMDGHKLPVGWRARPAGLDGKYGVAGDDRPVLIYTDVDQMAVIGVPTAKGSLVIERTIPLTYADGQPIQTSHFGGLAGRTPYSVADWDNDGRWDLLVNATRQNSQWFETDPEMMRINDALATNSMFLLRNVGDNANPRFERARRIRHADGVAIRVEDHALNVCATHLDGDDKIDLLAGDGLGYVYYFLHDQVSTGPPQD